jgi:hypothetical protein
LYDRVQETTATTGTGTITLGGAVAGYQSFAVVGNGNTTFYCIVNGSAWEVGIGTYSTSGPTLARTTVLSNSNGNTSPITLVGASNVFVTYPAGKSVNLDASGNVTALGTISSGTWQGSTVGVAYGGTGVTSSSGANSVMLRDANQNVAINRLNQGTTTVTAAGGTTTLTVASTFSWVLNGTGGQTFRLPDATTLTATTAFEFNNNATGTLTIVDNASGAVGTVAPGGAAAISLLTNSTIAGLWDVHAYIPENVTWGTNALNLSTTVITGGTWNGGTIASGYGGTGLTTFSAANNALYSTSSSALAAGTLPVLAGGTGVTTSTGSGSVVLSTSPTLTTPNLGTPSALVGTNITGTASGLSIGGNAATATTATNQSGGTVSATSGAFSSTVTFAGGSQVASNGDLSVRRSSGASGAIFFGNGTPYLYYDSSNFNFSGGNVYAGTFVGALSGTATTATTANALNSSNNYTIQNILNFAYGGAGGYIDSASSYWGMIYRPSVNGSGGYSHLWTNNTGGGLASLTTSGVFNATQFNGSGAGLTGTASSLTAALANGVNQYPNRTDGAWYQAVWSNAAGGDKNIYCTNNVTINSGSYGAVAFYGSTWSIGGNPSWGLGSNTGLYLPASFACPIMYDANNTGYYSDPSGVSNIYRITANGGMELNGQIFFTASGSNFGNTGSGMWFTEGYGIQAQAAYSLWNFQVISCSVLCGFYGGGGTYGNGNGYFTGGVNQYYSDERLKTKIKTIDSALEKVLSLDGFIYVENEVARSLGYTNKKEQVGVSAQKVQKILPQAVSLAPVDMKGDPETHEIISKSGENYLTVDYSRLVPLLIEAIKEQQTQINDLKTQIFEGK